MNKRAVILAGGKGTRLRPYTVVLPKPLMPIGEYPILEVIVRQLVERGFEHITMAVNHQSDLIKAFFQNGEKWGVKIDYSMEDRPLGTIAPLHFISDLPESFLVMNGDILTDIDYANFFNEHIDGSAIYSISAVETLNCQYGGDEMEIGFKSVFLIGILSNINSDEVVIELSDPTRAGILLPKEKDQEDEDLLMLLMPMMINA